MERDVLFICHCHSLRVLDVYACIRRTHARTHSLVRSRNRNRTRGQQPLYSSTESNRDCNSVSPGQETTRDGKRKCLAKIRAAFNLFLLFDEILSRRFD